MSLTCPILTGRNAGGYEWLRLLCFSDHVSRATMKGRVPRRCAQAFRPPDLDDRKLL
jgi:hypothetical protein